MKRKETYDEEFYDSLLIQINDEITQSIGWSSNEVHYQIAEAFDFYYRKKPLPSKEGFSTFVSGDVFDAIESNTVPLVETFTSNKQVVVFDAKDPSVDATLTSVATDEVNRILLKENDGYSVMHDFVKDGLLCKNGIVKSYWFEEYRRSTIDIVDLDDVALDLLLQEPDVDAATISVERKEITKIDRSGTASIHLNNGTVDKIEDVSRIVWETIAPEEFIIAERTRDISKPSFVGQRQIMTLAEITEMFPDKADDIETISSFDEEQWNEVLLARHNVDSSYFENGEGSANIDPLQRRAWVYEIYIESSLVDGEESKLYQVWTDRSVILSFNEVEESPYATWTPITVAHKFYGLSLADVTMDIQTAKTMMMRGQLDYMRLMNHPRMQAVKGAYDVRSLMDNRAGVIVEVKEPGAIQAMPTPAFPAASFEMITMLDQVKAERTGMSKASKGIDDKALANSRSGVQLETVMQAGELRMRGMARNLARMGIAPVMDRVYRLLRKYDTDIKVSKDLVSETNPTGQWTWQQLPENIYVETSVALGRNAQAEEANWKMQQLSFLTESGMITPEKSMNIMEEIFQLSGEMDTERYLPSPEELEQHKMAQAEKAAQAEQKAKEVTTPMEESEMKNRTYELEIKKMEARAKIASLELDQARLEMDTEQMRLDHTVEMMKIQNESGKIMVENKVAIESSELEMKKFAVETGEKIIQADQAAKDSADNTASAVDDAAAKIDNISMDLM